MGFKIRGAMKVLEVAGNQKVLDGFKVTASKNGADLAKVADTLGLKLEASENILYFRCKMLGYDFPNGNGDAVPRIYAANFGPSFIGKPLDVNHQTDPEHVIGKILTTFHVEQPITLGEKDERIIGKNILMGLEDVVANELQLEGICMIDRTTVLGDDIAKKLLSGVLTMVSQEAATEYAECTVCGHRIDSPYAGICAHLDFGSLMIKAYPVEGKKHPVLAYKNHQNPSGTGLGVVTVGAYSKADVLDMVASLKSGKIKPAEAVAQIELQEKVYGSSPLLIEASKEVMGICASLGVSPTVAAALKKLDGLETVALMKEFGKIKADSFPSFGPIKDNSDLEILDANTGEYKPYGHVTNIGSETIQIRLTNDEMLRVLPGDLAEDLELGVIRVKAAKTIKAGEIKLDKAAQPTPQEEQKSESATASGEALGVVEDAKPVDIQQLTDQAVKDAAKYAKDVDKEDTKKTPEIKAVKQIGMATHNGERVSIIKEGTLEMLMDSFPEAADKLAASGVDYVKSAQEPYVCSMLDSSEIPVLLPKSELTEIHMTKAPLKAGTRQDFPGDAPDKVVETYQGYSIEESGDNFYVKDPKGYRAFTEIPVSIDVAKKWIDRDIADRKARAGTLHRGRPELKPEPGEAKTNEEAFSKKTPDVKAAKTRFPIRLTNGKWRDVNGNSYDNFEEALEAEAAAYVDGDDKRAVDDKMMELGRKWKGPHGGYPEYLPMSGRWRDVNGNSYETYEECEEASVSSLNGSLSDVHDVTAVFYRNPDLAKSYWLVSDKDEKVLGRFTLAAIAGGQLNREISLDGKKVSLFQHLQSEDYGKDLVAHVKKSGAKKVLGVLTAAEASLVAAKPKKEKERVPVVSFEDSGIPEESDIDEMVSDNAQWFEKLKEKEAKNLMLENDEGDVNSPEDVQEFIKNNEAQIVKKARYEVGVQMATDNNEDDWRYMLEELQTLMDRFKTTSWKAGGKNMGWQQRSGEKEFQATDAKEFLENILPNTDTTIHIYDDGDHISLKVSHHDAPTGEFYEVYPAEENLEAASTKKSTVEASPAVPTSLVAGDSLIEAFNELLTELEESGEALHPETEEPYETHAAAEKAIQSFQAKKISRDELVKALGNLLGDLEDAEATANPETGEPYSSYVKAKAELEKAKPKKGRRGMQAAPIVKVDEPIDPTPAIEQILSNDEASSDEELVQHFIKEMGLSEADAQAWVAKRGNYLLGILEVSAAKRWGRDKNGKTLTLGSKVTVTTANDSLPGVITKIDSDGSLHVEYEKMASNGYGYGEHSSEEVELAPNAAPAPGKIVSEKAKSWISQKLEAIRKAKTSEIKAEDPKPAEEPKEQEANAPAEAAAGEGDVKVPAKIELKFKTDELLKMFGLPTFSEIDEMLMTSGFNDNVPDESVEEMMERFDIPEGHEDEVRDAIRWAVERLEGDKAAERLKDSLAETLDQFSNNSYEYFSEGQFKSYTGTAEGVISYDIQYDETTITCNGDIVHLIADVIAGVGMFDVDPEEDPIDPQAEFSALSSYWEVYGERKPEPDFDNLDTWNEQVYLKEVKQGLDEQGLTKGEAQ